MFVSMGALCETVKRKCVEVKLFGIIGAGDLAIEVMPLAKLQVGKLTEQGEDSELVFVVENDNPLAEKELIGHRVLKTDQFLSSNSSERFFNIAISNSIIRERVANSIPADAASPFSIVAPNHVSLYGNRVGEGALLCCFTHLTSNVRIGRFFHGNFYSYVAHDCVIGDFVTFAPGVRCNGHVVVEDHAYIGSGAVIKDGTDTPVVIGRGAVVGMGAVVTKSVAPGTIVVGNPARVLERTRKD